MRPQDSPQRHLADKYLAQGDYIRALETLAKLNVVSDSVAGRIQEAVDRMKHLAARELATGHWTVAEGIFGVMQEHEDLLTPAQKAECDLLVNELRRCRREEQSNALLQASLQAAAQGLHRQAREMCFQALQACDDAHLAGRLRRLMIGLRDPRGQLVYGFDSPLEIRQFCHAEGGASIAPVVPAEHFTRGAYARLSLPRAGAKVLLLDVPEDWTIYSGVSFSARHAAGPGAAFTFGVSDGQSHFVFHFGLAEKQWTRVDLPLHLFEKSGAPSWDRVTHAYFLKRDAQPIEFDIDEVRLIEKSIAPK